jgi:lysyl-tRNA synthetase class I
MPASLDLQNNFPPDMQNNIPPICPPCPTCGKEMRMVSVTQTRESVVYGFLCGNDHVLEFTIGDR